MVVQNYAPPQQLDLPSGGWRTDQFGQSCAGVAVCLVIKHPDTLSACGLSEPLDDERIATLPKHS